MKATILTLIAAVILTATTATTKATAATTTQPITLTGINNINKIEAHGNVEVYIVNGTKDAVKVYDTAYYASSALVQEQNGTLRVTNYDKAKKLLVEVTVTDLRNVVAYDNAVIKSDKLALIGLTVDLYNNAYAGLQLSNYAASINVNDQAKADLAGDVMEYNLTYSYAATVNRTALVAMNTTENRVATPVSPAFRNAPRVMASI
ncbi:hypothetical protein GCM10027049_10090 [Mucilaginibacter puniceus]